MPRRNSWFSAASLLIALSAIASCRDSGTSFQLDGKLVVFNYRVATATFLVNLKHSGQAPEGMAAVATFENPAGGAPIVVEEKIWPKTAKTTINTPALSCIVKDRPYEISIRIIDASGREVQKIETTITSSENQDLLPDKPLVVGPFYTPNPDVAPATKPTCAN